MSDLDYSSIALLVALIVLHAVISLSAASLEHSRTVYLRERSESGDRRARRALRLTDDPVRLTITTQTLLTFIRVAFVAILTVQIAEPLIVQEQQLGRLLIPELGYTAVLAPAALLAYILGDLLPGAVGKAHADRIAPWCAWLMRMLQVLLNPIVFVLVRMRDAAARAGGGAETGSAVTPEEIIDMVDAGERGGTIEDEEAEMILSVLEFDETFVREVMVPRLDISAVEVDEPLREALRLIIESGHSRIPVYEDEIDNICGVLYAKDLLNVWYSNLHHSTIRDLMRPPHFIPETKRADALFKDFQAGKIHIAIVVDEYGSTAGVVTLEDLIEEIVGDIRDEYDQTEVVMYVQHNEHEYTVDAGINLHDFNSLLDVTLPTEGNDSLGGFIYTQIGHVPEEGETVEFDRVHLRIESLEGVRIRKVHVTVQPLPTADGDEPERGDRNAPASSNGNANASRAENDDVIEARAR